MALVAATAGLTGAGCDSFLNRKPPPPCPPVYILKDAGSLTRYKPGAGRDIIDVLFRGQIVDFKGVCDYNKERTKVTIELGIAFELLRGPANRDRKATFGYIVAIPHFYPAPQGRNIFSLKVQFAERDSRVTAADNVQITIPLDPKKALDEYGVYLGFQLTRQEVEDNRKVTKY